MIKSPSKTIWKWIIGFNYFNLMDALLTLLGTTYMGAKEINPIMKVLLESGPVGFIGCKLIIGLLATYYFVRNERYKLLKIMTCVMAGVVGWNIIMILLKGFFHWKGL